MASWPALLVLVVIVVVVVHIVVAKLGTVLNESDCSLPFWSRLVMARSVE
jgi:type II secretory pathway component PulF